MSPQSDSERDIGSKIAHFFTAPAVDPATLGMIKSTLYLLRRDVNFCLGIDHETGAHDPTQGRAIFPGVMTIMAGWDLLGKFLAGDDDPYHRVGARLQAFIQRYVRTVTCDALTNAQAWCLWQLRNCMLHSFGLLAKVNDARQFADVVRFVLAEDGMDVIVVGRTGGAERDWTAVVDYWKLHAQFEQSIVAYRRELENPASGGDLRNHFDRMWTDYGRTKIQP